MCARVNVEDQSKILVVGSRDLKGEWTTATAETTRCKMVPIRIYSNLKYFMVKIIKKQIFLFSI
jgi:hypothetical protein